MRCYAFVVFLLATSLAAEDVKPETPRTERQSGWFAPLSTNWPFYDSYADQEDVYQLRSLLRRPASYSPNALQFADDDSDGQPSLRFLNRNTLATSRPVISFLNNLPVIRNPNFPTWQNLLNSFDSCTAATGESGICAPGFACSAYGGRPSGTCSLGTVCCINVVSTCTSQMTLNNTYWETPSTAISRPTGCSLTIKLDQRLLEQKKAPICQVRLDFISFSIEQPNQVPQPPPTVSTATTASVCSTDVFRVNGVSNTPPDICGDNPGQHMYITVPSSGNTATNLNLVFSFGSSGTVTPAWKIKVSLLPCGANYLAPDNCLQYFTSVSGTVQSFNWKDSKSVRQLANQNYRICFRTELMGNGNSAKSLCLKACTTDTANAAPSGFSLTGDTSSSLAPQATSNVCTKDYLIFAGGYNQLATSTVADRFCGTAFNALGTATVSTTVCSDIQPFALNYVTDGNEPAGITPSDTANIGFCFNYVETA